MKKFIIIILVFTSGVLTAQNSRVERAVNDLKPKTDKEIALALNDSSFDIRFRDAELALEFARRALPFARKTQEEYSEATTLFNIGTAFHIIGTYDSALYYYQKAEPIFLRSGDPKSIGTVYLQVSLLFSDSGNEDKAIEYNNKSLNCFYKARDTTNIIGAFFNMAVYYSDPDSVVHYQNRGLKLLLNYVTIEPKLKALKLSIAYTNLGNTYQKQRKYSEAVYYLKLAVEEDEKHDDFVYKISSYENLGSCYQAMGEPRKAISVLRKAIDISKGSTGYRTGEHLSESISYAYLDLKMYDSAFYFMREYAIAKDSISNIEKQKVLNEMQEKYDSDKKAVEIELLSKDKESAATFRKTLYVIIALILLVVIALIYSYVLKQRSNKDLIHKNEEIKKQKQLVEEKQKEIIDSIRYAKRIQQSLMPTGKYISKKLDELKK